MSISIGDQDCTDEDELPTHSVHMRQALQYCLGLNGEVMAQLRALQKKNCHLLKQGKCNQQRNIDEMRQSSLEWFHRKHVPLGTIPIVNILINEDPTNFRRKFHKGNLPCLVRGLDQREFASITKEWTTLSDDCSTTINRDWFLQHVGAGTKVPVRKQPPRGTLNLDEDGRAHECETLSWTMQRWIDEMVNGGDPRPDLYLKDWHLVPQWHQHKSSVNDIATNNNPLYKVPAIFQHDVLNAFLTRFTNGDYRFVYWGPAQSETQLHSDVLNSFSWSYNVVGHKRWTFYPPSVLEDSNAEPTTTTKIVQDQIAGECMFVPSGWKHEVMNVEETLSINHNWITSANVDRLLASVDTERLAVDEECLSWGIEAWDAREHMLRGCAGLDLTACFFVLWSSLLDAIVAAHALEKNDDEGDFLETNDDIVLLHSALEHLLSRNEEVGLLTRLSGVLAGDEMAAKALAMVNEVMVALANTPPR